VARGKLPVLPPLSGTNLLHCRLHDYPNARWEVGESLLQQTVVCDAVLLKAVKEGCWSVFQFRLFDDHHTLEVGIHTRGLCVSPNGNVCVVTSAMLGIVNSTKALIEEVIEAFVDAVCLCHQHRVSFNGRVTNCCNCIDLKENLEEGKN